MKQKKKSLKKMINNLPPNIKAHIMAYLPRKIKDHFIRHYKYSPGFKNSFFYKTIKPKYTLTTFKNTYITNKNIYDNIDISLLNTSYFTLTILYEDIDENDFVKQKTDSLVLNESEDLSESDSESDDSGQVANANNVEHFHNYCHSCEDPRKIFIVKKIDKYIKEFKQFIQTKHLHITSPYAFFRHFKNLEYLSINISDHKFAQSYILLQTLLKNSPNLLDFCICFQTFSTFKNFHKLSTKLKQIINLHYPNICQHQIIKKIPGIKDCYIMVFFKIEQHFEQQITNFENALCFYNFFYHPDGVKYY